MAKSMQASKTKRAEMLVSRVKYVKKLKKELPQLSLDSARRYAVDKHLNIHSKAKSKSENIIHVRSHINSAIETAVSLSYKAWVEDEIKTPIAQRAIKAFETLMESKDDILALSAVELAWRGQMWGPPARARQANNVFAQDVFEKLQKFIRLADRELKDWSPPPITPVRTHDYLSGRFLLFLADFWKEQTGQVPPKGALSNFTSFAADAWTDLGLRSDYLSTNKERGVQSWLGEKWRKHSEWAIRETPPIRR